jgi:serine/threonine protein kinase/WD40 repeat protein
MLLIHTSTNKSNHMYLIHTANEIKQSAESNTRPLSACFPRQASKTQDDLITRLKVLQSVSELLAFAQQNNIPYPSLSTTMLGYAPEVVSLRLAPEELDWGYLAPELMSQDKAERTPKSDSFSLGCIFYELISGESNTVLQAGLRQGSLKPLRQLSANIPAVLDGLVNRLLSPDQEKRPLPSEIKNVLSACLAGLQAAESATVQSEDLATIEGAELAAEKLIEADTLGAASPFEQTVYPEKLSYASQEVPVEKSAKSHPISGSGSAGKAVPLPSGVTPQHLKEARSNKPEHKQLATVERHQYEMSGELARGGLGKITIAKDTRLDRQVAIKELLRDRGIARARFLREALLTARLQHPGIVPIYEAGVWPSGEPFYTMKLIAGKPFDKIIKETKTLEERLAYLPQVLGACQALAFAHSQKIIHRDLKPHNMIVGDFGETVVIDWGLAKDLAVNDEPEIDNEPYRAAVAEHHDLTQAGEVMGTPAYMPIEQARGQRVTEAADVYALGGILYHLLTGEPPYTGKKSLQVIKELLDRPPVPVEVKEPNTPKELAAIVHKAMAREAKDRYPTAKELADDLQKYQTGQLVGVYQYSPLDQLKRWARKNKGALTASLIGVALLTTFGVYSFVRISNERQAATEQRHIAIDAAAAMEKERDHAQKKEAEVNQLYKKELLEIARERVQNNPQEAIAKLQEVIDIPGETDWSLVRMLAMSALSNGIAHGPASATAPIPSLPAAAKRMAVSPDGTQIAVARVDGFVSLFTMDSTRTSEEKMHEGAVNAVAFSPDGKYLATAGEDHKIVLRDLAANQNETLLTLSDVATSIAFKGSHTIAASGHSGEILLYNIAAKTTKRFTFEHKVHSLAISSDEKWLAASGDWHSLVINLENGKEQRLENIIENNKIVASASIVFSPDGQKLALVDSHVTGFVHVFGITKEGWGLQQKVKLAHNILWGARFSTDGTRLAVTSVEGTVYLVELSEARVFRLHGHKGEARDVAFAGDSLLSVGSDKTLRVWDLPSIAGETLFRNEAKISAVMLTKDGKTAFFGAENGDIFLFDMEKRIAKPIGTQGGIVRSLSVSADQSKLLSSGVGSSVLLWDLKTNTAEKTEVPFGDYISTLSPDGEWFAFNNYEDPKIYTVNTGTREKTELSLHKKLVSRIWFVGGTLHTCSADEKAFAIDLGTNEIKNLQINARCQYLDIEGGLAALTGPSPSVSLFETASKKELAVLAGKTQFSVLQLSSGGDYVSAFDVAGALYIWNPAHPKLPLIKTINYHSDMPLAFVPGAGATLLMTVGDEVRLFSDTTPKDPALIAGWLHSLPISPVVD